MNDFNKKPWAVVLTIALVLCGIATACSPQNFSDSETDIKILTIGTADSGGTMYPVGTAIAEILSDNDSNLKINLSASSGSTANAQGLADGQIDLGLISGDIALCAYQGVDSFQGEPLDGLRAIAAVYSSMSNWMVLAESELTYVHQLEGLTLAIGPQDSTTELSARIGLSVLGIDASNSIFESYSIGAGSTALQEGLVDAVHGFAGVPISALDELSQLEDIQLLQYTQTELDEILAENPAYSAMTIPAYTYQGQTEAIDTFGVKCLLCVDASMDETLVYEITKTLVETISQQGQSNALPSEMADLSFLYEDLTIPLHSGAQQYYGTLGQ